MYTQRLGTAMQISFQVDLLSEQQAPITELKSQYPLPLDHILMLLLSPQIAILSTPTIFCLKQNKRK